MTLDEAATVARRCFNAGAYVQVSAGDPRFRRIAGVTIGRREFAAAGATWEQAFDRLAVEVKRVLNPEARKVITWPEVRR